MASSTTSSVSSTNMYRVGDYVYFETASTSPFQVRRIEELNKTPTGNVEAKVMCFFRRRDLPQSLTFLADRHQSALEEEGLGTGVIPGSHVLSSDKTASTPGSTATNPIISTTSFSPKERHLLQHRELFLSRQVETLPTTLIRGRCSVTLLNETENLENYLTRDDTFFYSLVYDPQQKTLLADKGEIRVGSRYQAEPPKGPPLPIGEVAGDPDHRNLAHLETLLWTPSHGLTDKQIDQFLVLSRSVGTFARALDCSSSVKQPSLHMSAAAASRDVTLFHAMNTLHKSGYDLSRAVAALVPSSGPLLCRDELEEWSASEANLFEEALDKYGKDFNDIRSDYLPWKTGKNLVEYYYMWKTTDRYVQQKRVKAAEAETKLKQVYIPNYNKTGTGSGSSGLLGSKSILNGAGSTPERNERGERERDQPLISGKPCESCLQTSSIQWYAWTGSSGIQARLCNSCWHYWRKYGGLKIPNKMLDGVEMDVVKKFGGTGASGGIGGSGPKSDQSLSDNEHEGGMSGSGMVVTPIGGSGTGGSGMGLEKSHRGHIDGQGQGSVGGSMPIQLPPGLIQQRFHRCAVQGCGKDFKMKNQLARHYASSHGFPMRSGSPRPVMKTRTAFYLHTTPMTRVARRLCSTLLKPRHASRCPFWPINSALIKQECQVGVVNKSPQELRSLVTGRRRKLINPKVADVSFRLGQLDRSIPNWLILTEKSKLPKPIKEAYPKPPKGPDGSLIYERVPEKFFAPFPTTPGGGLDHPIQSGGTTTGKKRGGSAGGTPISGLAGVSGGFMDELGGMEVPPAKRERSGAAATAAAFDAAGLGLPLGSPVSMLTGGSGVGSSGGGIISPSGSGPMGLLLPTSGLPPPVRNLVNHVNGARAKIATVTRVGSRKQIISWMDAPDDLYFSINENSKKLRRSLTPAELRRLARSPCKKALLLRPGSGSGISGPAPTVPPAPVPVIAPELLIPPIGATIRPSSILSVANLTGAGSTGGGDRERDRDRGNWSSMSSGMVGMPMSSPPQTQPPRGAQ